MDHCAHQMDGLTLLTDFSVRLQAADRAGEPVLTPGVPRHGDHPFGHILFQYGILTLESIPRRRIPSNLRHVLA